MRQLTKGFLAFTATVRLSKATGTSIYSMCWALHCALSAELMGREASAMSSCPAQNFLNPPPVPGEFNRELHRGVRRAKRLCDCLGEGKTVSDPSIVILPDRGPFALSQRLGY